ncbi:MAG: T9SS type A sorting domain-containing protein [Bacteroidota bacterium]
MRIALLLIHFLLISQIYTQEVSQITQYAIGTEINYYIGQCGETPPEADGKLTFCDGNGNLGVVAKSLGLSGAGVQEMLPNYFDETELYLTRYGLAMRYPDGEWENIPNQAVPTLDFNDQLNNTSEIETGFMDANGLLHLVVINFPSLREYWTYNRVSRTFENIPIPDFQSAMQIAYDQDNGSVFIMANLGGTQRIYERESGGTLIPVFDVSDLPFFLTSIIAVNPFEVFGDSLYVANNQGLLVFNKENFEYNRYDFSETGKLPFDIVNDIAFDDQGAVWLAQAGNTGGGIVRLSAGTRDTTVYRLARPDNPTFNLAFSRLDIKDDGNIATIPVSSFNIADLDWQGDSPSWTVSDLGNLLDQDGVDLSSTPNQVYNFNGSAYYPAPNGSVASNDDVEVLILKGDGSYETITDDTPTSISAWQVNRYNHLLPDSKGGVYAYGATDDIITYIDNQGRFRSIVNEFFPLIQPTVDDKDNLVRGGSSIEGWQVLDFPISRDVNGVDFTNGIVSTYGNSLAFFDRSSRAYFRVLNGSVVDRDTLPEEIYTLAFFNLAVDDNGVGWMANAGFGNGAEIVSFDPGTETTNFVESGVDIGQIVRILPGPGGEVFIVGSSGVIHYSGSSFTSLTGSEEIALSQTYDAAVDEAGRLWLLSGFTGTIHRIDDFDQDPSINTFAIEDLLPFTNLFGSRVMTIDSDGDLWLEGGNQISLFEVKDIFTAGSYRPAGGINTISGQVYADLNSNGQFDDGEAVSSQVVSLLVGDRMEETLTNVDGSYSFLLSEGNTPYTITLPSIDRFYFADNRQLIVNVGSLDQDYTDNDFELIYKDYNSLYFQTANKIGAFGFEREGFENTFTTAVTNLSSSQDFRELEVEFIYHHKEETNAVLPNVLDVQVTKLTPEGVVLLVDNITIDPATHDWQIRGLSPSDFSINPVPSASFSSDIGPDTVRVNTQVGDLGPRETLIIEINTDLFDPIGTGVTVVYSPSKVSSPDLEGNDPVIPGTVIIYPEIPEDGVPHLPDDPNSPYVSPDEIYEDPPYLDPSEVYSPPPYATLILSSYDPNDKLVDGGRPDLINDTDIEQRWLNYTIRFENTGNFSAKDVWVIDTLHPGLDPASLRLIEASHEVSVDFIPDDSLSVLRFSFENIFLPFQDTINDGYVRFALRTTDEVMINDLVTNRAGIYFDQNPPIITNLVRNRFIEIMEPSSTERVEESVEVSVFPNPSTNYIRIDTPHRVDAIQIFDAEGRLLIQGNGMDYINVNELPNGQYTLVVLTHSGTGIKKLIIQ